MVMGSNGIMIWSGIIVVRWFESSIDTFGHVVPNPLEYVEDEAVEDNLFSDNDIDIFPGEISENREQRHFDATFLDPQKHRANTWGSAFPTI